MKAMLISKRKRKKKKKKQNMEIKHHFISANINFNAVLLFNSTTERHIEASNLIIFNIGYPSMKASLIAQLVKNLPLMQKIPVRFLGQEDLLEKG